MSRACETLRVNCVDGITANEDRLADTVSRSVTVIAALAPVIGYAEAAKLANEALQTHEPVADLVIEHGLLDREQLDEILQPAKLAGIAPEVGKVNTGNNPEEVDTTSTVGEG